MPRPWRVPADNDRRRPDQAQHPAAANSSPHELTRRGKGATSRPRKRQAGAAKAASHPAPRLRSTSRGLSPSPSYPEPL
ncbi:hypothetical protein NY78_2252 [Desulfovibrio sp. TomC]|nr:hypothetical protein NY78_2252 [Desulfovibrio sp. TomC]